MSHAVKSSKARNKHGLCLNHTLHPEYIYQSAVALSMYGQRMLPQPLNTKLSWLFLLTGCMKALLRDTHARISRCQVQDNFPVVISCKSCQTDIDKNDTLQLHSVYGVGGWFLIHSVQIFTAFSTNWLSEDSIYFDIDLQEVVDLKSTMSSE